MKEYNLKEDDYVEKGSRSNERNIGETIKKCFVWRKVFNGKGFHNIETAAKTVGLTGKSLHYYLHQFRYY